MIGLTTRYAVRRKVSRAGGQGGGWGTGIKGAGAGIEGAVGGIEGAGSEGRGGGERG